MKILGLDRVGRRTAGGRTIDTKRTGRINPSPTRTPQGCFKHSWML